ncbi:MAG: SOS response-associated peptidase [Anaerolineae bacterium]|jgi:putative SOS response-associated peptidase YedK|nr:SOS response-associated peptidase [Anaerolineae bacterium]MBT7074652.1 SOS response-associated peptidase [Anaerolineae bacterium]MBT7782242.1 SOS response-associated peptidase [Anaerolineae bacterium]
MCGRFTLTTNPAESQGVFENFHFPSVFAPRFNIAPSQPLLAIPNDGRNSATFFLWGFIPSWAKSAKFSSINARAETLAEKPSFKGAYKYKRCLILADGFYEWQKPAGQKIKVPHYIFMKSRQPFAFAGLWSDWESPDGSRVKTCAIITTDPNALMKPIHKRMPVILPPSAYKQWLDPKVRTDLDSLLLPYSTANMDAYPVSTLVNAATNDRAECVVPA